jgi:hypothetical protein
MCVNFRLLNEKTIGHSRLLPKVSEVTDALCRATIFTKLDITSTFSQIPMHPDSVEKNAFCNASSRKQFCYANMPYGLKNSSQTFSDLMDRVLTKLSFSIVISYIDDLLVYSKTMEKHEDVALVLGRFAMANLKISPSKCTFFADSVELLGHTIGSRGLSPEGAKVGAVKNWPQPENVKDIQSFLAFMFFFSRFIPNFKRVAYPMQQLTLKDVAWSWSPLQQNAFDELKHLIVTAPVLRYPDPSKIYHLETDFSKIGFGWVLSQEDEEGHQHPVLYGSRSLSKQEQNYSAFRGEFSCLYEACTKLRHYLIGSQFIVYTDHKALKYMNNFKDSTGKMSHMMADLLQFGHFKIKYKPGKEMRADALSRIDWKATTWQELERNSGPVIAAMNWTDLSEDSDSIIEGTVAAL